VYFSRGNRRKWQVVDIRILGPTEVRHDGSPLALRGAKGRQLLVLLALRANRPLTTDRLIEELWEGEPPPSASSALRVHLGHLRRVLEPDRDRNAASVRLPAGPHGYLLRLETDELDSERFERKVRDAREANAEGEPAKAVPLLTQALDLWRGPALSDVRDLSSTRSDVARLDDLHAVAYEELARARLELGEHPLLVDVLIAAVAEFPLREELTASLMIALYRSHRAPDALRVYSELSRRLDEQLGVLPSERLRRLEQDILLERPSLDYTPRISRDESPQKLQLPHRTVGRSEELHDLLRCIREPSVDNPHVAVVRGPAGIGKSTLITELCSRAELEGVVRLVGVTQLHPSTPYEPIAQILRQALSQVASGADETDQEISQRILPDLFQRTMVPVSSETDERASRFRHFESVATSLASLLEGRTLIVVEDLHWADRPTLLLLRHLVRHTSLESVFFVVTYRDDEIAGEQVDRLEGLAPPSRTLVHGLRPFHDGEVRALVRAIASPEHVDFLVSHAERLRDVTGGNPFFLRELLRELEDESAKLESDEDLAPALGGLAPASVSALIERRVERLTTQARELIRIASAIGDDLSVHLLERVSGLPREQILDVVEECLAVRLLVEDAFDAERFHFPHALAANSVYAQLGAEDRMDVHRQIALVLASLPAYQFHVSEIARHFNEAAAPGLYPDAARYSELAGADASARFMFAEAAVWYERALGWRSLDDSPEDERLGRLQLALARAYANDKRIHKARKAFLAASQTARRIEDHALLADVAMVADGPWSAGSDFQPVALQLLEEALNRIDESDRSRRVQLMSGIASELYYVDSQREGEMARSAVSLAETLEDPEALATAKLALHRWRTHDPTARAERLSLSRSAWRQVQQRKPGSEVALPLQRAMLADLLENGNIEEFDSMLSDYERVARSLGSPRDIHWSTALRATQATLRGDLEAADQLARGAALRGHELEQLSEGALLLQRFVIRYQQARLREELDVLRGASQVRSVVVAGAALLATTYSEVGEQAEAEALARTLLGSDGASLPRDIFWLSAVALLSGVAAKGDDRELQVLLRELIVPCQDHVVVFGAGGAYLGTAHQWIGLLEAALGNLDSAISSFKRAWTFNQRAGAPFWAAQAQMDACFALARRARRGDEEDRFRLSRSAIETAERHGFERILQKSLLLA
jgi:DNA-binding SARP family transcriptional activator